MSTSHSEASRAAKHTKARESMMNDFEKQKQALIQESERAGRSAGDRFVGKIDSIDEALKKSTVGLVKLEDFQRTRLQLEEKKRLESGKEGEDKKKKRKDRDQNTSASASGKDKKEKGKGKKKTSTLSFQLDDDDEQQQGLEKDLKSNKKRKVDEDVKEDEKGFKLNTLKNPNVDTSFLPDRSREEKERSDRENLRREWLEKQEAMKKEEISITYSWWDGSGHRKVVKCKKGDSIAAFLEKCRLQFPDLRGISVDNMMYIKEDLIIPHHYTFYDFIVNKARGKSGPLFNFDVHDDIRLLADARIEKDESHAGKVVERGWYNRNKHIFPASRWEVYDPKKDYGSYTIG